MTFSNNWTIFKKSAGQQTERENKMSIQREDIEWDSAQAESEYDISEEKMAKLENMAWDNDND